MGLPAFAWGETTRADTAAPIADEVSLEVEYTQPIVCGTPTTFNLSVPNGSSTYQYRISRLMYEGPNGYESMLAGDKLPGFSDNTSFEITFPVAGRYWVAFDARDVNNPANYIPTKRIFPYIDSSHGPVLSDIIDGIVSECAASGAASDYEKALWFHDWILDHCEYDYSFLHCSFLDALVSGTGTCEAYHGALVMLLNRVGIETSRVEHNGHVWTGAKLDGRWCHIDATHDDVDYSVLGDLEYDRHLLFGLDDATLQAGLDIVLEDAGSDPIPMGKSPDFTAGKDSLANSYLVRSGAIRSFSNAYTSQIQAALDAGKTSFSLTVPASLYRQSYVIVNNQVAYQLSTQAWKAGDKTVTLNVRYADGKLIFDAQYGSSEQPETPQPVARQNMYRLYNPYSGEHFYTKDWSEASDIMSVGWIYEGVGWLAPESGRDVYRLYNPYAGDHHYTMDWSEASNLMSVGWNYEGVGWYSDPQLGVPLYRQYNPYAKTGSHNYTTDPSEHAFLCSIGWRDEGEGCWYGVAD